MSNSESNKQKRIPPKASDHKLLALGIFLAKHIARLPMPFLLALGRLVGRIAYYIAKRRRKIVARNIELSFPELSSAEQKRLVKENFKAMGMGIFEVIAAWWKPKHQLKDLFIYEGLEHLEKLRASGEGALLLTLHMCTLELGGRAISLKTAVRGMYRPHDNEYYEHVQYQMRYDQSGLEPITRDEIRRMIRLLRKGDLIWYAPDQDYGSADHVFVPFFGINTLTITASSTLTRLGRAKALPYYCIRKGNRYIIRILPPLEDFPTEDLRSDTARINTMFEEWIRQAPEQYLWAHRRFKSRPKGEKDLYNL